MSNISLSLHKRNYQQCRASNHVSVLPTSAAPFSADIVSLSDDDKILITAIINKLSDLHVLQGDHTDSITQQLFEIAIENQSFSFQLTSTNQYIGTYKNNMKYGLAIQAWSNGPSEIAEYLGYFHYDQRHGIGAVFLSHSNKVSLTYIGQWYKNNRTGFGITINDDHTTYIGFLKNSKRHGCGIQFYPNGDIHYIGNFIKNKKNGYVQVYQNNRLTRAGSWSNDKYDGSMLLLYAENPLSSRFILADFANGERITKSEKARYRSVPADDILSAERILKTLEPLMTLFYHKKFYISQDGYAVKLAV